MSIKNSLIRPLEYHTYPIGDDREHILSGNKCWCKPVKSSKYENGEINHH